MKCICMHLEIWACSMNSLHMESPQNPESVVRAVLWLISKQLSHDPVLGGVQSGLRDRIYPAIASDITPIATEHREWEDVLGWAEDMQELRSRSGSRFWSWVVRMQGCIDYSRDECPLLVDKYLWRGKYIYMGGRTWLTDWLIDRGGTVRTAHTCIYISAQMGNILFAWVLFSVLSTVSTYWWWTWTYSPQVNYGSYGEYIIILLEEREGVRAFGRRFGGYDPKRTGVWPYQPESSVAEYSVPSTLHGIYGGQKIEDRVLRMCVYTPLASN